MKTLVRWLAPFLLFASSVASGQTSTKGIYYVNQAAIPVPCPAGSSCMWVDSTNKQVQFYDGTTAKTMPSIVTSTKGDIAVFNGTIWVKLAAGTDGFALVANSGSASGLSYSSVGGETLAATYAFGAAAADQTMLINAGDGGPVIAKANGAATGALLQAQTSAAAQLFSIADNAQAYISGAAADSGTNKGVVLDTKTALTTGRAYCSVENGGTQQWAYYTTAGGARAIEAKVGTESRFYGNTALTVAASSLEASYLRLTDGSDNRLQASNNNLVEATTKNTVKSDQIDSATAICLDVDTTIAWSNAAAKLQRWLTNGSEKLAVMASGAIQSSTSVTLNSTAADAAGSRAVIIDTTTAWVAAGAKLLSWRSGGAEVAFIDRTGFVAAPGIFDVALTNGFTIAATTVWFGSKIVNATDLTGYLGDATHRLAGVWSVLHETRNGGALAVVANVISPTSGIHAVGAGLIKTITLPDTGFVGSIVLIPTAAFTYDDTGNINSGVAGLAVVGKAMIATYDGTKWYMSY